MFVYVLIKMFYDARVMCHDYDKLHLCYFHVHLCRYNMFDEKLFNLLLC